MSAFEIRAATTADEDGLYSLAKHLNTVNLPADRDAIRHLLTTSEQSFSGALEDLWRREYVFAIVDTEAQRIVGTSMILAQLGRRDAPYIYLDVLDEERYSATLDRHFKHTTLSIGYSYDGPTELGGLIVLPEYRQRIEKVGLLISYVRFLFIKMHRNRFRDELLAELLPPLEPDGRSHLWDALGHHFTGLTYQEADRLSRRNKEFIRGLFPEGTLYASLLTPKAQAVIGKVGAQTRGVEKMLRRIGFRYAERVDPFDGGPHFTAPTDEVLLVHRSHQRTLGVAEDGARGAGSALVGVTTDHAPFFHAVHVPFCPGEGERLHIPTASMARLAQREGDRVWALPVD
jgi:arginine N-succinyltransferase